LVSMKMNEPMAGVRVKTDGWSRMSAGRLTWEASLSCRNSRRALLEQIKQDKASAKSL